jgi:biopolymer transport protein ExbB
MDWKPAGRGDGWEKRKVTKRALFASLLRMSFVFALLAIPAMAQDEGSQESVLSLIFRAGGIIGYVIMGLSVIGLALIIEHAISVSREKLAPPDVIETIESHLDNNDVQGAYEFCEQNPNYLTNIMVAALPKVNHGFDSMEQAAQDVGEEEAIKLHAKISWLSLIGNIAPLLGLLGTVSGMLKSFGVIEKSVSPNPAELAGGIKEALVTTMLGLMVAVPVMVGFFFFRNRVVKIVLEISAIAEDMLDRFRPHHAA